MQKLRKLPTLARKGIFPCNKVGNYAVFPCNKVEYYAVFPCNKVGYYAVFPCNKVGYYAVFPLPANTENILLSHCQRYFYFVWLSLYLKLEMYLM